MRHRTLWLWLCLCAPLLVCGAALDKSATNLIAPPLPSIRALELRPAQLTLKDVRDERRVLVLGKTDSSFVDLTSQSSYQSSSSIVEINGAYIRAKQKGVAEILVSVGGQKIKLPVTVESADVPEVRFVRDIEPVLGKVGCNAGTCHGSAKGKNGIKLSLRGYDAEFDYQALVNDLSGRRINRVKVEESLMLLKPLAEVPHEGRQAIKPG